MVFWTQSLGDGNHEEVEKLDTKLAELEERAEELDKMRTSTIASIALINDRNRKNNILRAEKGIKEEILRTKREGTKEDPFNRRKTNPKLSVSKARVGDADDEEMTSEKLMQLELEKKKEKESKIQALKDQEENELRKKKEKQKKSVGTADIFNAHDFEIDINVAEMKDSSVPTSIALKPISLTSSSTTSSGSSRRS